MGRSLNLRREHLTTLDPAALAEVAAGVVDTHTPTCPSGPTACGPTGTCTHSEIVCRYQEESR